jgi:hypothetical protein
MVKVFVCILKVKGSNKWVVLCVVNNGVLTEYCPIEFLE